MIYYQSSNEVVKLPVVEIVDQNGQPMMIWKNLSSRKVLNRTIKDGFEFILMTEGEGCFKVWKCCPTYVWPMEGFEDLKAANRYFKKLTA